MKQSITPQELTRLAIGVAELPFIHPNREPTDYMLDVMETVINFHIQTPVVVNSLTYFREQVQQL